MERILALDYGRKRTGIAVTDPLGIFATALTTVETKNLLDFLQNYLKSETVSTFVVGMPKTLSNEASENAVYVQKFLREFKKLFPDATVIEVDERFTSSMAFDTMIQGGLKKKARQNKSMVDKISATIILQSFLEHRGSQNRL